MDILSKISKARIALVMAIAMIVTSLGTMPTMTVLATQLNPGTESVFPSNFTVSENTVGKWEGTELTLKKADGTGSANQLATGNKGYLCNSNGERLYVDATPGAFMKYTDQGGYFQFSIGTCVYVPVQLDDKVIVRNWSYTDRTHENTTRLTYEIGHNSKAITQSGEDAVCIYSADETDAANGYVLIKATNNKYIKGIEVVPTRWSFNVNNDDKFKGGFCKKGFSLQNNKTEVDPSKIGTYNGLEIDATAAKAKLENNGAGYAQFNRDTKISVPVTEDMPIVNVIPYSGQAKYTIGGVKAVESESKSTHAATAEELAAGYVDVVATGGAYIYGIYLEPLSEVDFAASIKSGDEDKISDVAIIVNGNEPQSISDVSKVDVGSTVTISANVIDGYEMYFKVGNVEKKATKGTSTEGKTVYTANLGSIGGNTEVELSVQSLSRKYTINITADEGIENIKVNGEAYDAENPTEITVYNDAEITFDVKDKYVFKSFAVDGVKQEITDNKYTVTNVTKDVAIEIVSINEDDVVDYGENVDEEEYDFKSNKTSVPEVNGVTFTGFEAHSGGHGPHGKANSTLTFKLMQKADIVIYGCQYGECKADGTVAVTSGTVSTSSATDPVHTILGADAGELTVSFSAQEYIHGFKVSYLSDNVNVTVTQGEDAAISNIMTKVNDAEATAYTDKITVASGSNVAITFDVAAGNEAFCKIGDADKTSVPVVDGKGTVTLTDVKFNTQVLLTTESLDRTYDVTIAKDENVADVKATVADAAVTIADNKFAAKANSKVTVSAKAAAGYEVFAKVDEHTVEVTKDGEYSVVTIDSITEAKAVRFFTEEAATEEGFAKTRWDFTALGKSELHVENTTNTVPKAFSNLVFKLNSEITEGASAPKIASGGYSTTDGKELGAQFRKATIKIPVVGTGKVYVVTEGTKCALDGAAATSPKMVAEYTAKEKGSYIELSNTTVAPTGGSYKDEDDYVLYIYKIENSGEAPEDDEPDFEFDLDNYANGSTAYDLTVEANYAGGTAAKISDIKPDETFFGGKLIAGVNTGTNKLGYGNSSDGLRYRQGTSILFPLKADTSAVEVVATFNGAQATRHLWIGGLEGPAFLTMAAESTATVYDVDDCIIEKDGAKYLNIVSDGDCKVKTITVNEFNPVNNVKVTGKVNGATGDKIVFTDISNVEEDHPEKTPYVGRTYEADINADGTYEITLKRVCGKTKYVAIITSETIEITDDTMVNYVVGNDATATINLSTQKMKKAVISGKLTGIDHSFIKDGGFKLMLDPATDGFADKELPLTEEADGTYSFKNFAVKAGETYTLYFIGLDDYEFVNSTISKAEGVYEDVEIVASLRRLVPITGKFVTSDRKDAAPTAITFTNKNNGYVYTFEASADGYEAALCEGDYVTTVDVEGYEAYDHVFVDEDKYEIENDVYLQAPVDKSEVPFKAEIKVGEGQQFTKIQDAVDYIARMKRDETNPERVTIVLTDALYRQQVVVEIPNITMESALAGGSKLTWYYGMGYSYYSAGHERMSNCLYYNEARAVDKYEYVKDIDNGDGHYGACLNTYTGATGFRAENIIFENSFNRYQTEEEVADGVGIGHQNAKIDRSKPLTSAQLKAANAKERAAAVYNKGADKIEFKNCTFISNQDTLYTGDGAEHAYYSNCLVEGNTDFIWGDGNNVFDNCILSVTGYSDQDTTQGYLLAGKKVAEHGFLFNNCTVQKIDDPEIGSLSSIAFARAWAAGKAAFINTEVVKASDFSVSLDARYANMNEQVKDATYKEYNTHYQDGTKVPLQDSPEGVYKAADILISSPEGFETVKFFDGWTPEYYGPFDVSVAKDANVSNVKYSVNGAAAADMPEKISVNGSDRIEITYTVADGYSAFAKVKDAKGRETGVDSIDNKIVVNGVNGASTIKIETVANAELFEVSIAPEAGVTNVVYSVDGSDFKSYTKAFKAYNGMKLDIKANVANGYFLSATAAGEKFDAEDSVLSFTVQEALAIKLSAVQYNTLNVTYADTIKNVVAEINGVKNNVKSGVAVNVKPDAVVTVTYDVVKSYIGEATVKEGGASAVIDANKVSIAKFDKNTEVDITAKFAFAFDKTPVITCDNTKNKINPGNTLTVDYSVILPKGDYDASVITWYRGEAVSANLIKKSTPADKKYVVSSEDVGNTITVVVEPKSTSGLTAASANSETAIKVTDPSQEGLEVELLANEFTYTGSAIIPEINVTFAGEDLEEGTDYSVKCANNVKVTTAKKATITVTGKGNFAGKVTKEFTINKKDLSDDDVIAGQIVTDNAAKAVPVLVYNNVLLKAKSDFTATYDSKTEKMNVTGANNYTGEITLDVKVVAKADLKKFAVTLGKEKLFYNGDEQKITVTVTDAKEKTKTLVEDTDYIAVYSEDIVNAGNKNVTVIGLGDYSGAITKKYAIKPAVMTGKVNATAGKEYVYDVNGVTVTDDLTVTVASDSVSANELTYGTDYTVKYSGNTKVGTAKYTVSFIGNYKGTKAVTNTFAITPAILSDVTVNVVSSNVVYKGKADLYKAPVYVCADGVALKSGKDYAVEYYSDAALTQLVDKNNKITVEDNSSTTVYVKVIGKGNFAGNAESYATSSYEVINRANAIDLSKAKITVVDENGAKLAKAAYTGSAVTPNVRIEVKGVELTPEQYATVSLDYVNNVKKGSAIIVVNGGAYGDLTTGNKTAKFSIVAANMSTAK